MKIDICKFYWQSYVCLNFARSIRNVRFYVQLTLYTYRNIRALYCVKMNCFSLIQHKIHVQLQLMNKYFIIVYIV